MDIVKRAREALSEKHQWELIPFPTHHGWEKPNYRCSRCHSICVDHLEHELPAEGCRPIFPLDLVKELLAEICTLRAEINKGNV